MKKNGFTLVELLAVIAILAILLIVAVPNVIKTSRKVNANMFCTKVENVEKAAQLWGNDNYDLVNLGKEISYTDFKNNGASAVRNNAKIVTLRDLVKKGYYKKDKKDGDEILDPRDDSNMMDKEILVYISNGRIYASYQFNSVDDYKSCHS